MKPAPTSLQVLSDADFTLVQRFLQGATGVALSETRRQSAASALAPRLRERGLPSFAAYLALLQRPAEQRERDLAIDSLTTHETAFFREPAHFALLRALARERRLERQGAGTAAAVPPRISELLRRGNPATEVVPARPPLRILSAGAASGEEVWSIAMTLAEAAGDLDWEVLGTDVGCRVIAQAREAIYPSALTAAVPGHLRSRYFEPLAAAPDRLRVVDALRRRATLQVANLLVPLLGHGLFDVIFLRNVLIYFDRATRARVVDNMSRILKPDGLLIVGHSETLARVEHALLEDRPTVYRKPDA